MIDLLIVMPAVTASIRNLFGRALVCRAHLQR